MSRIIQTVRGSKSLFIIVSVLVVTGMIAVSSQAMQGMPAPRSQPQAQPQPRHQPQSGPGIDWGKVFGPGPMIYPGEIPPQPPDKIDLLWPTDPGSGYVPPVEVPKLPAQQVPTPTVQPSTSQLLGLTGGNSPAALGAPVIAIPPGTNLGPTPADLLNNSPGNPQTPPGNQFAGPPDWNTPPGPGVKWPSPVGPDQDAIDAGKKLLEQQRQAEAEAAARKAEEDARKAEEDARLAKKAADDMIKKALELKQQAQQAIDDMQKKAQQAIDDLKKQAEQAANDAAADAAKAEKEKLRKAEEADKQQKQAAADAAKAQEQKARQAQWAKENAEAWKEHQAKEQKAQQEAQAQAQAQAQEQQRQQALQQQQAQQAQQQKQLNQQQQKQEQQDLDSRDTKIRKALGGGP